MSTWKDWNAAYVDGNLPWHSDTPDPELVAAVEGGVLPDGDVLEVGCGRGSNARYMADEGRRVTAVDFAPDAVAQAREAGSGSGGGSGCVDFQVHDMLSGEPPGGPYDAVFDRGVLHVFDEHAERVAFARHVAAVLRPGGVWLSLVGSTEGGPREHGPPRRTAAEILAAVEPELEVLGVAGIHFEDAAGRPRAWRFLFRKRELPAQPSSRHGG